MASWWLWGRKDKAAQPEHEEGNKEPVMAPSSLSDRALRNLAKRRGYVAHKIRNHDWWYLVDESGNRVNANEQALTEEERFFSKFQLEEFLRSEAPQ